MQDYTPTLPAWERNSDFPMSPTAIAEVRLLGRLSRFQNQTRNRFAKTCQETWRIPHTFQNAAPWLESSDRKKIARRPRFEKPTSPWTELNCRRSKCCLAARAFLRR